MSQSSHDAQDEPRGAVLTDPVYPRPMPGGGYVRAELLVCQPADVPGALLRGRVVMERRSYVPPSADEAELVVDEVEGSSQDTVIAELVRIARDNAAIARGVLRQTSSHPRAE
ncbi:MAG: hypothetical protein M3Z05_06355 [Gemmatimonadota bacterium]|nr:hypothetical protein [Gemmatimonadota bacterium]